MKIEEKLSAGARAKIREAVVRAFGNEILAVGLCNADGVVEDIHIAARGDDRQVPALSMHMDRGDVIIHNHPSGFLSPSQADLQIASELGRRGIGFFIVNNGVDEIYAVAEPVAAREIKPLDSSVIVPLLDDGGEVARHIDGFIPREQQLHMTEAVVQAFNNDEIAVIEAGTGVGKSFAYLLPAVFWAGTNSDRVIVTTNTINLQQQIHEKDLPLILRALKKEMKVVLAKGRSNYICLRRLDESVLETLLIPDLQRELKNLSDWAERTTDGSRSDLAVPVSPETWNMVCSEADSCIGLKCPRRENCFVLQARKEAAGADIIIANHHLVFADLAMKMEDVGFDASAVLPPCTRYIFDEAHSMEHAATSFFSRRISRFQLVKQGQRLSRRHGTDETGLLSKLTVKLEDAALLAKLPELLGDCRKHFDALESSALLFMGEQPSMQITKEDTIEDRLPFFEPMRSFHMALLALVDEMTDALRSFPPQFEDEPEAFEFEMVLRQFENLAENCYLFLNEWDFEENVYWLEKSRSGAGGIYCNFIITPLDMAPLMEEAVFRSNKTVVCTSATLTVNKAFGYWKKQVGLAEGEIERQQNFLFDSPFPYESNVLLCVPTEGPNPAEPAFTGYITELTAKILQISRGRGLVLFTAYKMMNEVFSQVRESLEKEQITCMKQGDEDRSKLLRKFVDKTASVLFATDSFWQGIDAPGDTCSVVILVKLPFRVPTEPVTKARLERLQRMGGNPFMEMSLPEAVTKLKQGFGRLMRKQDDRGIIVITDPRIVRKAYGKQFIGSLPETKISINESPRMLEEIESFLYG